MILKNRIALLKRETNKSQRKVVETQKKNRQGPDGLVEPGVDPHVLGAHL